MITSTIMLSLRKIPQHKDYKKKYIVYQEYYLIYLLKEILSALAQIAILLQYPYSERQLMYQQKNQISIKFPSMYLKIYIISMISMKINIPR